MARLDVDVMRCRVSARRTAIRVHTTGFGSVRSTGRCRELNDGAAQCLKDAALRLVETLQVLVYILGGH